MNPRTVVHGAPQSTILVEPLDDFVLPPPESLPQEPQGEFHDNAVRGEIFASGPQGLELNCGAKALRQLSPAKALRLTLRVGGATVPLVLLPGPEHTGRSAHIVGSAQGQGPDFFMRIFSDMYQGGDDVFRAFLGEDCAVELTKLLDDYAKGCTFTPHDGYVPKDPAAALALQEKGIALWTGALEQLAVPGAMHAALRPHWDNPKSSTLSCRPIDPSASNLLIAATTERYELRL